MVTSGAVRRAACLVVPVAMLAVAPGGPAVAAPTGATPVVTDCADLMTPGVYEASHVRVEGDLAVAGPDCRLADSVVTGRVTVTAGGELTGTRLTIKGDLAATDGFVTFIDSHLFGGATFDGAEAGMLSNGSTFRRSLRGNAALVWLRGATVDGAVNLRSTDVELVASRIGGWVNVVSSAVDVLGSELGRGLTLTSSDVAVCGVRVSDDMTVDRARSIVQVGWRVGGCPDLGPDAPVPGKDVSVGGDVVLVDDPHSVVLRGLTVRGDLTCAGTTGPAGVDVGPEVTVAGILDPRCTTRAS
jgi:hypothetical protein